MTEQAEQLDPYAVLGVAPDATQRVINHAYRQLLRRHHPDTQQRDDDSAMQAPARLQQILTAYALLRDPSSRAKYDREVARRRRVHGPKKLLVRPAPAFVSGDVIWSEADPPIRAGPVWRHRDPTTPRADRANG